MAALWLLVALLSIAPIHQTDARAARKETRVAIIANPSVSVDSLEVVDLQRIYLSKRTRWPDDTRIVATMLKGGSIHKSFVEDILERSVSKFATYWKQIVFTGQGVPPKAFDTEEELIEFVAQTPGSIGYVSIQTPTAGVHSIALVR
ncbi:MAG: hypothetical protein KDA27_19410 [Candidatus Eisenbacteria bacterium]|uniref:PBP domain-containing protein n=1 Tax=Eiseniibacteriota bacterium TaxID=2212470 RepID=A0A956SFY0_UNCEI|nr:hypothetical protein [Candidatus Eisenbacteria bacterium]